jgi:hypothetical protein
MTRRRSRCCRWLMIDGVGVRVQTNGGELSEKDRAALIELVRSLQTTAQKRLAEVKP